MRNSIVWLSIIFILIIIPISIALHALTKIQHEEILAETQYDTKLIDATRDTLSAYQKNIRNESESDLATTRIRLMESAVGTFYTSLENNLSLTGSDREALKEYVPALVFTMYDGFYIYSPYNNITNEIGEVDLERDNVYYGVRPYIYYSCRYRGADYDIVITYSLDNYIRINGIKGNQVINDEGYLLSDDLTYNPTTGNVTYAGVEITPEGVRREFIERGEYKESYPFVKINGTKYYYDRTANGGNGEIFYFLNQQRIVEPVDNPKEYYENNIMKNSSAYNYYKEAYQFRNRLLTSYTLGGLRSSDAVTYPSSDNSLIFGHDGQTRLENKASNFNKERERVIRASIEENLKTAIANFNNYSANSSYNYLMPTLDENEWKLLCNNISIVSFLQGLNLKTRIYNGHVVLANDESDELVKEGNIYIINELDHFYTYFRMDFAYEKTVYHSIIDKDYRNNTGTSFSGILSTDFLPVTRDGGETYFYARMEKPCYDCIVQQKNIATNFDGDYYKYVRSLSNSALKKAYYTALGRERYGMYRVLSKKN